MSKPTWIIFEGIDGSGKTTQARLLNQALNDDGVRSRYRHVFDTEAGRLLRSIFIENSFSNAVEILILGATRQAFLDQLAAEDDDYDVLIVDRFFLSILSMQGTGPGEVALIRQIEEYVHAGRVHAVFYLDTPPEGCKKRLDAKRLSDRIEARSVEFHRGVYDRYDALLASQDKVYVFDGDREVEQVHLDIVAAARELLEFGQAPLGSVEREELAAR